jgi:hypothetical protein
MLGLPEDIIEQRFESAGMTRGMNSGMSERLYAAICSDLRTIGLLWDPARCARNPLSTTGQCAGVGESKQSV